MRYYHVVMTYHFEHILNKSLNPADERKLQFEIVAIQLIKLHY